MAAVMTLYPSFFEAMATKGIHLLDDDIRLALLSHTMDTDPALSTWSDVSGDEIEGSNYPAGGKLLTGKQLQAQGESIRFIADSLIFSELTASFRYGVLYGSSSGVLIGQIDFSGGGHVEVSGLDYLISWHSDGVLVLGSAGAGAS